MLRFIRIPDAKVRQDDKPLYLNDLQVDEPATVLGIDGADSLIDRLFAIGISTGVDVRLLRRGTAVVVHAEGGRFCLREEDARRIAVCPANTDAVGRRRKQVA